MELAVWTHYVARDTKPEILADMPSKHVPKVDRFPSTIETPASNGEVREENNVEAEPVKNGGESEKDTEEPPLQLPPVSFEDAVPEATPEPEVTPEPEPAVNGHEQAEYYQQQVESSEVPTEALESSPQVPAAVEAAPALLSEVQAETPPIEVPLEPSANGISYGAGGNGWEVCSFSFYFARSLCSGSCQMYQFLDPFPKCGPFKYFC